MEPLSDDLLNGVAEYADFIGWSERRCLYLLQKGELPGGKIGSLWVGSKQAVREHVSRIAIGEDMRAA